ncbi:hypothetical protein [Desulfocucumis palustris]|uniref:hypothetical protein n=1 Tax=Desulfocucumis palustris TaxID=1898651 RepID=UPI000CEA37A5|nr:hypothetical protein [Desulfocucumis palustris]
MSGQFETAQCYLMNVTGENTQQKDNNALEKLNAIEKVKMKSHLGNACLYLKKECKNKAKEAALAASFAL